MLNKVWFPVALALTAGVAAPAEAADLRGCVEANITAAHRQQVTAAYRSGGIDALEKSINDAIVTQIAEACVSEETGDLERDASIVGNVLAGALFREAATPKLLNEHGLNIATLNRAWSQFTPAERAKIGDFEQPDGPPVDLITRFAKAVRPDVPDDVWAALDEETPPPAAQKLMPLFEDLILYAMGRGAAETAGR